MFCCLIEMIATARRWFDFENSSFVKKIDKFYRFNFYLNCQRIFCFDQIFVYVRFFAAELFRLRNNKIEWMFCLIFFSMFFSFFREIRVDFFCFWRRYFVSMSAAISALMKFFHSNFDAGVWVFVHKIVDIIFFVQICLRFFDVSIVFFFAFDFDF